MADNKDYYAILGVDKSATKDELKKAYRKQAKKYHPDANQENKKQAEQKFKEINEAYSVLSDDTKRAQYDRFGSNFENMGGFGGGAGFNGENPFGAGFDFSGFSNMGGMDIDLEDILGSMFGGGFAGARPKNAPRKGADLKYNLSISFEEAVFGVRKEISFARNEYCSECSGTGAEKGSGKVTCDACGGKGKIQVQVNNLFLGPSVGYKTCDKCAGEGQIVKDPCQECKGKGIIRKIKKITVTIPAGIDEGQILSLDGEGDCGKKGGPNGDLYVVINIQKHKIFNRDKNTIYYEQPVSFIKATMGGSIKIPTLEGEEEFVIPEGTQQGTKFTLKGRGVPYIKTNNSRGNLEFIVNIEIPKKLNEKQRQAMQEVANVFGEEVNKKRSGFFR